MRNKIILSAEQSKFLSDNVEKEERLQTALHFGKAPVTIDSIIQRVRFNDEIVIYLMKIAKKNYSKKEKERKALGLKERPGKAASRVSKKSEIRKIQEENKDVE